MNIVKNGKYQLHKEKRMMAGGNELTAPQERKRITVEVMKRLNTEI